MAWFKELKNGSGRRGVMGRKASDDEHTTQGFTSQVKDFVYYPECSWETIIEGFWGVIYPVFINNSNKSSGWKMD